LPTIRFTTIVEAPVQRCFLLALSARLHGLPLELKVGPAATTTTSGILRAGQKLVWSDRRARHSLAYTTLIDAWRPYTYFHEVLMVGPFTDLQHEHHFAPMDTGTRIRDELHFTAPPSLLSRFVERRLLRYLRILLEERSARIKQAAESEAWHGYLDGEPDLIPPSTVPRRRAF